MLQSSAFFSCIICNLYIFCDVSGPVFCPRYKGKKHCAWVCTQYSMWLQHFTLSEIYRPFTKLPVGVLIPRYSFKALHFGTLFAPAVISTSDSMLQQLELIGFYRFIEEKVVCIENSLIPLKPQQFNSSCRKECFQRSDLGQTLTGICWQSVGVILNIFIFHSLAGYLLFTTTTV